MSKRGRYVKKAIRRRFGLEPPGRSVRIRETDRFLVSYPKSGNTWARFIVGNLVASKAVDFTNIESILPDIYVARVRDLARAPPPRILKSHEPWNPSYPRVIYIVRHPLDVLVSYFFHQKKRGLVTGERPSTRFAASFFDGDLDSYGTWAQHVRGWTDTARDHVLTIRYEDMKKDGPATARIMADHFALDASEEDVKRACEASSFSRMKKLESSSHNEWKPTRQTRADIPFVRRGHAGGWQEEMDGSVMQMIPDSWRPIMARWGYHAD